MWYKIAKEKLEKEYVGTTDKDKVKVYLVNGGYIRDNKDVDFVWGGHNLVYDFIPKNEIWIERHDTDKHDMDAIIEHEIVEYLQMKYKHEGYEDAHSDALKEEKKFRKETE